MILDDASASAQHWRKCVGVCLVNDDGLAWGAQRIGQTGDVWQMPQGGIDEGEDPETAARRELYEETGVKAEHVELVAEYPQWLAYEFPEEIKQKNEWLAKYRGRAQTWFLFRFKGKDADVDISGLGGEKPEFQKWQWMPMERLEETVIEWKRGVYTEALGAFKGKL